MVIPRISLWWAHSRINGLPRKIGNKTAAHKRARHLVHLEKALCATALRDRQGRSQRVLHYRSFGACRDAVADLGIEITEGKEGGGPSEERLQHEELRRRGEDGDLLGPKMEYRDAATIGSGHRPANTVKGSDAAIDPYRAKRDASQRNGPNSYSPDGLRKILMRKLGWFQWSEECTLRKPNGIEVS